MKSNTEKRKLWEHKLVDEQIENYEMRYSKFNS